MGWKIWWRIQSTFNMPTILRLCKKMGSMLTWTIQQLQREISAKSLTASQVYAQTLARARKAEDLNAFITLTPEIGAAQAQQVDKDGVGKSLAGVPIAVKDNFCVDGARTTCASRMLWSFTPPYTATVVQRLFNAGAVLVGKTNLDEFGMGSGCVDSSFGKTANAWDPECISGGSSGGSAVAVAVGVAVAALGSDTGGSTTNPACYNGLVGLKPTYGSVSRHGLIPLVNSMDVPGIMTRNVDDAARIFNVISGWDEKDSTTVNRKSFVHLKKESSVKGIQVGIPADFLTEHLSDEVVDVWRETAQKLLEAGATITEVRLPNIKHSIAVYSVLNQCEVASNMARYTGMFYGLRGDSEESTEQLFAQSRALGLGQVVRRRILSGNYFLLAENYESYFVKAMQVRRLIVEDFEKVWPKVDLLLTPVTLSDAPKTVDFLKMDARAQSAYQDFCTQPVNMAGIPAVTVPVGLSPRGLPLGLQLLAPRFHENSLLNAAKFVENLVDFQKYRTEEKWL